MGIKLDATIREDKGKGASRRLRHENQTPAIIYGGSKTPFSIAVQTHVITHLLEDEAVYTSIIDINLGKIKEHAIIKDLQRHPAKNIITHIDFQRVNPKVAITTRIPLSFIGSDDNEDLRLGAVLNQFITAVEVSCLPADLPHNIDVEIGSLKIGERLRLTDLVVDESVQLTALNHDDIETYNQIIVSVSAARKIEEIEEDEAPVEEGSADGENTEENTDK